MSQQTFTYTFTFTDTLLGIQTTRVMDGVSENDAWFKLDEWLRANGQHRHLVPVETMTISNDPRCARSWADYNWSR